MEFNSPAFEKKEMRVIRNRRRPPRSLGGHNGFVHGDAGDSKYSNAMMSYSNISETFLNYFIIRDDVMTVVKYF